MNKENTMRLESLMKEICEPICFHDTAKELIEELQNCFNKNNSKNVKISFSIARDDPFNININIESDNLCKTVLLELHIEPNTASLVDWDSAIEGITASNNKEFEELLINKLQTTRVKNILNMAL